MALMRVWADDEATRWLESFGRRVPRAFKGRTYRWDGAAWWHYREVVEAHDQRRDGRAPDLVLDGELAAAVAQADECGASQGDIDDAFRGLEPVEVVTPSGEKRIDYPNVPLKNADGSLTKYGKRMIDLHTAGADWKQETAQKLDALTPRETLVAESGREVVVPARLAREVADAQGLRPVRRRRRRAVA